MAGRRAGTLVGTERALFTLITFFNGDLAGNL